MLKAIFLNRKPGQTNPNVRLADGEQSYSVASTNSLCSHLWSMTPGGELYVTFGISDLGRTYISRGLCVQCWNIERQVSIKEAIGCLLEPWPSVLSAVQSEFSEAVLPRGGQLNTDRYGADLVLICRYKDTAHQNRGEVAIGHNLSGWYWDIPDQHRIYVTLRLPISVVVEFLPRFLSIWKQGATFYSNTMAHEHQLALYALREELGQVERTAYARV